MTNQRKRILIVDDEELNRELLEGMIASLGHDTELACNGMEALEKMSLDIDLVLLDVMMPGLDGFDVARFIRDDVANGDVPIIMATALMSKEDRLCAVEVGANDYIAKPIDMTELRIRIASLLKLKAAQDEVKEYHRNLEGVVEQRTDQLRSALSEVAAAQRMAHEAHLDTIQRLAVAAELRDSQTASHIHRVSHYCVVIARALGLPPAELDVLFHASAMHDVGKIGISDNILLKPGALTSHERNLMQQHADIGARILGGSSSELLKTGEIIARTHHERWDGSGYPNGLSGEDIPLFGRICAIADVFDALTSQRSYKDGFTLEKSLDIMKEGRGKHFDPTILDVFLDHFDAILEIYHRYQEPSTSESAFALELAA